MLILACSKPKHILIVWRLRMEIVTRSIESRRIFNKKYFEKNISKKLFRFELFCLVSAGSLNGHFHTAGPFTFLLTYIHLIFSNCHKQADQNPFTTLMGGW